MKRFLITGIILLCAIAATGFQKTPAITYHHCTYEGGSGNTPHRFDTSEIYRCDEGSVEIAGTLNETIEQGYVYETELGRPGREQPYRATQEHIDRFKWCSTPQLWDENEKVRCGDKPVKCWDGKMATWDPNWQGYSCVTPDHGGLK